MNIDIEVIMHGVVMPMQPMEQPRSIDHAVKMVKEIMQSPRVERVRIVIENEEITDAG